MKTFLAAVDFSDASAKVLARAAEFVRAFDARLVLLHVVEPVASYVPVGAAMDVIEAAPPTVMQPDVVHNQARLEAMAAGVPSVEAVAIVGLAADEIVIQAQERNADMILLGSHGHGALYHLFTGSVVTGVLKRAKVPVLVVPVGSSYE